MISWKISYAVRGSPVSYLTPYNHIRGPNSKLTNYNDIFYRMLLLLCNCIPPLLLMCSRWLNLLPQAKIHWYQGYPWVNFLWVLNSVILTPHWTQENAFIDQEGLLRVLVGWVFSSITIHSLLSDFLQPQTILESTNLKLLYMIHL